MKLLEVKNNLAKVLFDNTDNLILSGFLIIADNSTPYVAQIMSLKSDETGNFAIAKLLFTFDNNGIVKNYDGSIPSLNSEISILNPKELIDILPVNIPVKLGQLAQQNCDLNVDKEIFEHNLLVCANNAENVNVFLSNIVTQFELKGIKSIVFDLEGNINHENKIKFPEDFKLPLDYNSINYIYENDLNDIDATSKAIIQDIFIELQNYLKTLEHKFIPFDTFIDVIDGQYRETKMSQLILLKNKLLKYKEHNIFAQDVREAESFIRVAECGRNIVIDLSEVSSEAFKMYMISYIYKIYENLSLPVYSFVWIDDSYANKPFLKLLTSKGCVSTTIITAHEFKYIKELKAISNNFVLFAPLTIENDFASYNTLLNKLNPDEFIIVGDLTQHIPFIIQLETLEFQEETQEEILTQEDDEIKEFENTPSLQEEMNAPDSLVPDKQLERELNSDIPLDLDIDISENDEQEQSQEQDTPEFDNFEIVEPEELSAGEDNEYFEYDESQDTQDEVLETFSDENLTIDENPEVLEVPQEDENVVSVDYDKENPINENEIETQETDSDENENLDFDIIEEPQLELNDENLEINDSDLDLISDNMSADIYEIKESNVSQEHEETPIIPVYPAEEIKKEPAFEFKEGDRVVHPKYGEGVIEKIVNYGTKKLCSIIFSGDRKRLLDPAISEIQKI